MADFSNRTESAGGPATEMWRRTLFQIPTVFGRLVRLARLRGPGSGRYEYPPLAEAVGQEVTDRTLANSHHQVFAEWIAFSLAQQKADLDEYLSADAGSIDAAALRSLMPATAHEVERQLYLTDLETLLALRGCEPGGAFRTREP